MDKLHDIVRKYKSEVIPIKLDVTELMTYVHGYLDVVEIDPQSLGTLIELSKCNIAHMQKNYGIKKLTDEKVRHVWRSIQRAVTGAIISQYSSLNHAGPHDVFHRLHNLNSGNVH